MLDQDNVYTIEDDDILQALNRAQDEAASIMARHYPEFLLRKTDVTLTAGTGEYTIPERAFEDNLLKVELKRTGYFYEVERRSYRDITELDIGTYSGYPQYYYIYDRNYTLVPSPDQGYEGLRIWYLEDPLPMVKSQGRVTKLGSSNNIYVDEAGSDLSTLVDNKNSYVNIIDGTTGKVKGSLQILSITDNRLNFKSTPNRSVVDGLTISSSTSDVGIEVDDYVSTIHGTCIPFRKKPLSNFLIEFAIAELHRKLGDGDAGMSLSVADNFRKQMEHTWAGRETRLRIKSRYHKYRGANRRRMLY